MKSGLIFLLIGITAVLTFRLAIKKSIKCPKCGSNKCKKTGKYNVDEVRSTAIGAGRFLPFRNYEYKCPICSHIFHSKVEDLNQD